MGRGIRIASVACAAACLAVGATPGNAQARKPAPRRPATRPAARPPARPAAPAPVSAGLTAATLGPALKQIGLEARIEGPFHRVKVDEEEYGYLLDFSISKSGEWLVGTAHLAPIPDLTKVPAAPLLSLLAANDALVGMYFSYSRESGQILLNATVPARALRPADLRGIVEGMRATVRQHRGLWDPASW